MQGTPKISDEFSRTWHEKGLGYLLDEELENTAHSQVFT
jgi:hypothetical protein